MGVGGREEAPVLPGRKSPGWSDYTTDKYMIYAEIIQSIWVKKESHKRNNKQTWGDADDFCWSSGAAARWMDCLFDDFWGLWSWFDLRDGLRGVFLAFGEVGPDWPGEL